MTTTTNMQKKQFGKFLGLILIGASLSLPAVSSAQERGHNHRIVHQRIKNHFDRNDDGTLNGREAIQARKFHTRWHNQHNRLNVRPHKRLPVTTRSN